MVADRSIERTVAFAETIAANEGVPRKEPTAGDEVGRSLGTGSRGVYILANNRVFDLVVAFLNSFRATNPELPLCLIPFDDHTEKIARLADRYHFSIFDDRDLLQSYDQIGCRLQGRAIGQYRKIAAWKGPYERFIFIDIDTVVLRPLDEVFDLLDGHDYIAGHSHFPNTRMWTWRDSAYAGAGLSAEQIDYSANTGFFASKVDLFSDDRLAQTVASAMPLRAHMNLGTYEQAFLNYLVVTLGIRYTSLSQIEASNEKAGIPCECWPGDPKWKLTGDSGLRFGGKERPVLFIHWAGCWWATNWDRRCERILRALGFKVAEAVVRRRMRLGRVWRHYRQLRN